MWVRSSMVEQSALNRLVEGSSPSGPIFYYVLKLIFIYNVNSSSGSQKNESN